MPTREARLNHYSMFEAAKERGAQVITTDYYLPSTLFPSTYQAIFKEGKYLRKNKLNGINNLNEEHKK